MADLPAGVYDLLDSGFATSDIFDLDKVNRDADGNLIGALPDSAAANRPTAEMMNGVCSALRQASTFFRGTASLTAPISVSSVLKDTDYSTLANNAFADGNETIDGDVWVAGDTSAATSFGVENGTGIHFDATTTSTALTSSNVSCARIRIAFGTLSSSWDKTGTYLIETYFSSLTLGTNNNRVALALYKDATTDAMIATGRHQVSGTQRIFTQSNTTITNGAITVTSNCFALLVNRAGAMCLHGTYSGGFPTLANYTDGGYVPHPHVADFSLVSPEAYLMIGFVTGEAGGAMDAVLRRLRVTRVG